MSRTCISTVLALWILVLPGCSTSYKESGFFKDGFEETRLDVDLYQIRFEGNGWTSEQRVSDFAFLRAAELTLEAGYSYFIVLESRDWIDVETGSGKADTYCYEYFGQQKCNTRYDDGQTEFPKSTRTIKMFESKPTKDRAYSAWYLYESLTEKYGIEKDENLRK